MNYETTPDCVCGGTGTLLVGRLNRVPCHECLARWDRTHCTNCEKRFVEGEGRCSFRGLHGEVFFCEACNALRPKPEEDYRAIVLRFRAARQRMKLAHVEVSRCCREFDRDKADAAFAELRAASKELSESRAVVEGDS